MMINVYIDNFLIASKYKPFIDWIKSKLKNKYNIKEMKKIKTIIG